MRADVDEQAKKEIKEVLVKYDRTLLVADPRRCEPKKCARPRSTCQHSACLCQLILSQAVILITRRVGKCGLLPHLPRHAMNKIL